MIFGQKKPHLRCVSLVGIPGKLIGVWECFYTGPAISWHGFGVTPLAAYNYASSTRTVTWGL